jgi:hypothetical protein
MRPILLTSSMLLAGTVAAPALAGTVTITIPRLSVAEYHRPYVAVWIEPAGGGAARTLAVWYEIKKGGNEPGTKWLSDLRAWWRKGGRSLALPANGVSGATRAPGQYKLELPADLKPGAYVLNVEAARETGGRELVTVPLNVPKIGGSATGKGELGAVTLSTR